MTPFAFDTLSASKQLREAGMDQGVAAAVVAVFQHAASTPDISHLATKVDIADMATRSGIERLRAESKADFQALRIESKADLQTLRADLSEKMRLQGWAMMGGTATVVAIATAIIKLA